MLICLSDDAAMPKGRQILARILDLLDAGHLRAGEPLPSTRDLAAQLQVHRSTIAGVYQELWALGRIDLRPGARPRVRPGRATAAPDTPGAADFPWDKHLRIVPPALPQPTPAPGNLISFEPFAMDPRLMPLDPFTRSLRAAMRRQGPGILGYGDPQGQPGLRAALCRHLGQHGIDVAPKELLVTQGAQQALDLALRALTRPGDAVLVQTPTYDKFLALLDLHGLRPVTLPMGPTGPDWAGLEVLIARERPVLAYVMPSFINPTGASLDLAQRETLLDHCGRFDLPLIEDGFTEEMSYFRRPLPPLKALDRRGLVLHVGTFSKVLFPGARLGWIAAPRACLEALTALRHTAELGPSPLLQEALEDFLRKGHFETHLARLHRRFRRRMERALSTLRRELDPTRVRFEAPSGGYLLWLACPGLPPDLDLAQALTPFGVAARSGAAFYPDPQAGRCHLRLSISNLDEAEIAEGLTRLGRALKALPG